MSPVSTPLRGVTLYISDIASTPNFGQHRGITFDIRDELIAAIRTLGYMLGQDETLVDALIERMLADVDNGMARSGLAAALMRGASEPAGPVAGSVTLAKDGWVIGGRFSEHNTYGLPQRPPFLGYSLRINHETSPEGTSRYRLAVTDQVSPTSLDPARVGPHHTESLLAAQLGRPRPLASVQVCVFYEQDGPEVDFGLVPIIDALASIEGLDNVSGSPEDIAHGYLVHMRDENYGDWSFQVRLTHTNGCSVSLNGFSGIQARKNTIGRQLLIRCESNHLVGPYDDIYRSIKPFVTFGVRPPKSDGPERGSDAVLASNQLAIDLADALTTALWSNNVG
jgi:hypothetical protein